MRARLIASRQNSEEDGAAPWERRRPGVETLVCLAVQRRELLRFTSGRRHLPKLAVAAKRETVVVAPREPSHRVVDIVADGGDEAIGERDRFQQPAGRDEGEPSAVRRKGAHVRELGATDSR